MRLSFVADATDAEALAREGIARHRLWTAGELLSILRAAPLTTDMLATVMHVRQQFGADVTGVKRTTLAAAASGLEAARTRPHADPVPDVTAPEIAPPAKPGDLWMATTRQRTAYERRDDGRRRHEQR